MKKVYYLSTCSTCSRILKNLPKTSGLELQDIKTNKITAAQLEQMKSLAGSYKALFSRRAIKYKSMGLKDKNLSENDFRELILEEYTFLKRPVFLVNYKIFIGSASKTIEELHTALLA